MTTFFTSDNHFDHKNILRFTGRPFDDIDEMETAYIWLWNRMVTPKDEVFILGDFCFDRQKFIYLHNILNGHKFYVMGNHDPKEWRGETGAVRMRTALPGSTVYVNEGHTIKRNKVKFFVSHRPFASWPWDAIHLHGHTHAGNSMHVNEDYNGTPGRIDVGVDAWGGAPVAMETILELFEPEVTDEGSRLWDTRYR